MSDDLLHTKLFVPRLRPSLVARPRLLQKLTKGLEQGSKLTLVSAPAGFGKTTLVSEWLDNQKRPFAWLSLDEKDADLSRFLTYITAALQTIAPDVGSQVLAILRSTQLPPTESILTLLLNEISAVSEPFILVLDDYHVLDSRPVDEALNFLLEQLPPKMHLVITTREDPNLPLPRWRVRSQLTELRINDLRFSLADTTEFLRQVMGLNLSEDNIATLEARTEGWIAGLQLAALSIQGSQDVAGFIRAFTGDNRYIVDYLVEEVLQQQPEPTRRFLLQTAVLDRLNGSLCTAVTLQPDAKARLEALERGNFFLIPLDDKRHWYRYHHLFGEVLQVHLLDEQPEAVPILHRRASEWFEQNGSIADAIRHALVGKDFERAARLIERSFSEMGQNRQELTLLAWFQALPEGLFPARPVLSVNYAGTLLQNGRLDGVEARLADAERWLDKPAVRDERPIYVDENEFKQLPGTVGMYRAALALICSDLDRAKKHARQILEFVGEADYFRRGAASSLLGLTYWTEADLDPAYDSFANGMAYLEKAGYLPDVVGGCVTLADIKITQGCLREAMGIYKRGLQLATNQDGPPLRGAADMHVGLSELYREHNDLTSAEQHLLKNRELGDFNGLPKNPYRSRVALARLREAQGELEEALELLSEAEPLYMGDFSPHVRPLTAVRARLWINMGRLDEAIAWAGEQGLSAADELSYVREFEHISLARLLLAEYKNGRNDDAVQEAAGLLERLLTSAEAGGRMSAVIEILILQALTHQLQGSIPAALAALQRAVQLAEPEGYVRLFLNEGPPLAKLLRKLASQGIKSGYVGKLLEVTKDEQPIENHSSGPSLLIEPLNYIEPLSQRELEILRLFQTELSGPEIADELVIALSTVRTHTKGIYSKLNVNSRRAAVFKAEKLGLI